MFDYNQYKLRFRNVKITSKVLLMNGYNKEFKPLLHNYTTYNEFRFYLCAGRNLLKKGRSMSHLVYYNIDSLYARYRVMQYLSASHAMYYDELYKYLRSRGDVPFRSI